jgi:hypothetical protein
MEPAVVSEGEARVRRFVEGGRVDSRRLTAEWLAGRLGVPVGECAAALQALAADGVLQRHGRRGEPPWFEIETRGAVRGSRRVLLAAVALLASCSVVAAGALLEHVIYFAMGLAVGIMITFAWLDWELRSRA